MAEGRDEKGRLLPGHTANPGGRPRLASELRAKALKAVDEHVIDAWIAEVRDRGDEWLKCSELLAAYGLGKPKEAAADGGDGTTHSYTLTIGAPGQASVTVAAADTED